MNTKNSVLPPGFEDLEPLLEQWSRPTENERNLIRLSANAAQFANFYAAMEPRIDALLTYLARCEPRPPDGSPDRTAMLLACAFAEAAPHHELYGGSPEVPHSFDARRFVPDHGTEPS